MSKGGDILEITYNHPTVGSGVLFCKAAEDGTMDRGGYRSNDDANGITGNGQMLDQLNRVRWSYETPPISWDMTDRDELDKLSQLAASPVEANWTIQHITGAIFGGTGKPVGDLQGNTNTALISVKLAGSGQLKKIS